MQVQTLPALHACLCLACISGRHSAEADCNTYRQLLHAVNCLLNAACLQTDLVASPELVAEVHAAITAINAGAEVIHTSHSRLDLTRVLNRGAFNPSQTSEDVSHLSLQLCGAQISPGSSAIKEPGSKNPSGAPLPCSNASTDRGNEAGAPEASFHDMTEQRHVEGSQDPHDRSGHAETATGERNAAHSVEDSISFASCPVF